MKKLAAIAAALSSTGFTCTAVAHGGHGVTPPASVIHFLTEPTQVIVALALLAAIPIVIRLLRFKVR